MDDFRTRLQKQRGWWMEEKSMIPCKVSPDGLLVGFHRNDVESVMDAHYPHNGNARHKVWWWNDTKDREIGEVDITEDVVYVSCVVLWDHFLTKEMGNAKD